MVKANANLQMGEPKRMSADMIDLGHALTENHTLPGLTDAIMRSIFSHLESTDRYDAFLVSVPNSSQLSGRSFFSLLVVQHSKADIDLLLDSAYLKAVIVRVFQGVVAQYAQQGLTVSAHIDVLGELSYTENRLLVQSSAFWTLTTGFCCILGLLCSFIFK